MAKIDDEISELKDTIKELDRSLNSFNKSFKDNVKDWLTGGKTSEYQKKLGEQQDLLDKIKGYEEKIKNETNDKKKEKLQLKRDKAQKEADLAGKEAAQIQKAGKAAAAAKVAGIAADVAKQGADLWVKLKELDIKEQQIKLSAAQKIVSMQTAMYGKAVSNGIKAGTGTITASIKENVYTSMDNVLEIGKQSLTNSIEFAKINFNKTTDLAITDINKKTAVVGAIATSVGGALSSIPNPYTAVAGAAFSIANSLYQAKKQIDVAKLEFAKQAMEMETDLKKQLADTVHGIVSQFTTMTKKIDDNLMTLDNQAHLISRNFGFYGNSLEQYTKAAADINAQMSGIGKTYEQFKQSQENYIKESGRNVLMNGNEGLMTSSLDMLFGLGDGETSQLMGAMNVFNTSIESGSDIMFEMYKTANKMGVSNQKFAKDMQKNLKLAEKYQFKGGVKGMMDMALWAQKTRFNMDSLSGMLDKMHTGNIEDVLQTSAKLNVLGGAAGMLSDPMSMLYNAYMNPAEYAKNINKMIAGYGSFDKETGETTFNMAEQMRIEAIASATGTSKEDLMNQARQTNKEKVLKKKFGNRFSGEKMDLLTQHATYDQKNKKWVINVMGNDGKVTQRNVEDLRENSEEFENIFPKDTQEQLVDVTKRILSLMERGQVVEKENAGKIMRATQGAHERETVKQQMITRGYNERNLSGNIEVTEKGLSQATTSLEKNLSISEGVLQGHQALIDNFYALSNITSDNIKESLKHYDKALEYMMEGENEKMLEELSQIPSMSSDVAQIRLAVESIAGTKGSNLADKGKAVANIEKEYEGRKKDEKYYKRLSDIYGNEKDFGDRYAWQTMQKNLESGKWKIGENGEGIINSKTGKNIYGEKISDEENANNGYDKTGRTIGKYAKMYGETVLEGFGPYAAIEAYKNTEGSVGNKFWHAFLGGATSGFAVPKKIYKEFFANDLIISPRNGGMFETDPEDTIMAFKPGGSLDRSAQKNGGTENINLTVNGTLTLSTGNQKIDLMELVRNDPDSLRRLTEKILLEASSNKYGGRHTFNASRYTI